MKISSKNIRILKTLMAFAAYVSIGWSQAVLGPALLDFRIQVNVSIHQISFLIFAAFSGYGLGNLLVSFADGKLDMQVLIIGCLFMASVASALAPWLGSLYQLSLCHFVNGTAGGLVEAAVIAYLLYLWGHECTVFLQALDFLYGVGSILGPAIAKPFLVEENVLDSNGTAIAVTPEDLRIYYPYSIIATYCASVGGLFAVIYLLSPKDEEHPSRGEEAKASETKADPRLKFVVVGLVALLYMFTNGMAMIIENFITSYIMHSDHKESKATGAFMVTVSWTVHTALCVPSVFLIKVIGLKWNLAAQVTILTLSSIVFLVWAPYSLWAVWLGVILGAMGNCSIFGSLIGYLEQYFTVSGRMTSYFLLAICIGDIICPMYVGQFVEDRPEVFTQTLAVLGFIVLGLFLLLVFVMKRFMVKSVMHSPVELSEKTGRRHDLISKMRSNSVRV